MKSTTDTKGRNAGSEPSRNESHYRNPETAVDNPRNFDDDFANEKEEEMVEEEARTEDESDRGKN